MIRKVSLLPAVLLLAIPAFGKTIRVGYFPNVTHAQALIGLAGGQFEKALGDVRIETRVFNAGPSAVEALFADALDLSYIGPGPAINAYVKSGGKFKIAAGAATGGAALVVRADAGIAAITDFDRKRLASPQLGNTQDLSARAWLKKNGFKLKEKGGTVLLLPVSNPDQFTLFLKKDLDAAWTVEPWVSRLVSEGNCKVFLEESEIWKAATGGAYATAVILVSEKFSRENPDVLKKWIEAHCELTLWIQSHSAQARQIVNEEIRKLTGKALSEKVLQGSFARVKFSYDPVRKSIAQQGRWAYQEGFLGRTEPDLSGVCDLALLDQVLISRKLKAVGE